MLVNPKTLGLLVLAGFATARNISPRVVNLDASELQRRSACASPGVANGQCGRYYRNGGCNDQIGAIDPGSCSGTCYQSADGIASLQATGDGTYGTNCVLYEDSNCQNQLGETGNSIFSWNQKCYTAPSGRTGHSFHCWRKC
ncbi:hypothetical protein F4810DRAFT_11951 [Camillea tinctor]|nr:hypothetical protein F4810DRAFT_11951 [Camillea tinctor]